MKFFPLNLFFVASVPRSNYRSFVVAGANRGMAESRGGNEYYRADGVRITHDPYTEEMYQKYGKPGNTDNEGFDPYADTVGPGIYGGIVKRDETGKIIIGQQYQNHNPTPGPVYAGGGYTPMVTAIHQGREAVAQLLDRYPDLVNEVSTGGATPLHMCGMSRGGQQLAAYLIERGANVEALDTYGFTPLHRMASNNLPIGAKALIEAGCDITKKTGGGGGGPRQQTALDIARSSRANDVVSLLLKQMGY